MQDSVTQEAHMIGPYHPRFALVALLASSVSPITLAGQQPALDPGSYLVGGEASFSSQSRSEFDEDAIELTLMPYVQYFVSRGLAIGGELELARSSYGDLTITQFGIGPAISYYFVKSSPVQPFARGSIRLARAMSKTDSADSDQNLFGYRFAGGILVLLSDAVGLDMSLYYDRVQYRNHTDIDHTTFGLAVGISAFLF
jgi:hypothetical protein